MKTTVTMKVPAENFDADTVEAKGGQTYHVKDGIVEVDEASVDELTERGFQREDAPAGHPKRKTGEHKAAGKPTEAEKRSAQDSHMKRGAPPPQAKK